MPKKTYTIKDWSGGVNLINSPSSLEENESHAMENFRADNLGNLKVGGDYTRGALTGMTTHVFTSGEGLHLGTSDYNNANLEDLANTTSSANMLSKKASWFEDSGDWTIDGTGSGATVTFTQDQGIAYGNGGTHYQKHNVKCNTQFVKENYWYQFFLIFNQTVGASVDAWDGHIDLFLGLDPTSSSAHGMDPIKYRHTHNIATLGGGVGGIYIHPGYDTNSTPFSGVTSEAVASKQCIATGITKTGSFGGTNGYLWLFGHPNGATSSPGSQWTLAHIQIRELTQDIDSLDNAKGDIFLIGGDKVQHYNGTTTKTIDYMSTKRSDYDADAATDTRANSVQTSESNRTNMYQPDSLMRVSDGNFDNDVSTRMYGPIVRDEKDTFQDDSRVTVSTTTPRGPYFPQIRHWYQGQQNVNSVFPKSTIMNFTDTSGTVGNGFDKPALNVLTHNVDMTSTAKELDDIFHQSLFGSPTISIHQGAADDGDIKEEWKKKWHFGISYRLIDNSYTQVFTGYIHPGDAATEGTYVPLGCIISKPGFFAGIHATDYIDATLTGKTIYCTGGANGLSTGGISGGSTNTSEIRNCTLYIKNHMLVGLRLPEDFSSTNYASTTGGSDVKYPAQGAKIEVRQDALDGGGGSTVVAEGFIYVRNNHALVSQVDMTAWVQKPSITLGFRYNCMDKNILLDGDRTSANSSNPAFGDFCANPYDNQWYRTGRISGVFNESWDPRINGFVIWAYAEENASMDTATPWSPIIEVDLDEKKFIPYTFDSRKRDLVRNDNYNFNHHFGACYHLGDDFTLAGDHHHDNPPSDIAAITYANAVGYGPEEERYLRWKASAVCNGRAVIGNLMRGTKRFPDKIAVSYPQTFDIFPDDATGNIGLNDGEDIVDMASYGDKLLVFKKTLMYILDFSDPSSDGDIIGSYKFMGVHNKGMVATHDYGISWVSPRSGVHHYDGKEFKELTGRKLRYDNLGSGLTDNILRLDRVVLLAYDNLSKTLHLRVDASSNNHGTVASGAKSLDGWVYSFETDDWYLAKEGYGHATSTNVAQTNFINTLDNKVHAYMTNKTNADEPNSDTGNTNALFTIDPLSNFQPTSTRLCAYKSREIDFANPTLNKKVYKVIIKYKYGRNSGGTNGGYTVSARTNGNYDSSKAFSASGDGNVLTNNSGSWIIHTLTPDSAADFKDIKTLAIVFDSIAHAETGKDFEVDSINIIYREWHAK